MERRFETCVSSGVAAAFCVSARAISGVAAGVSSHMQARQSRAQLVDDNATPKNGRVAVELFRTYGAPPKLYHTAHHKLRTALPRLHVATHCRDYVALPFSTVLDVRRRSETCVPWDGSDESEVWGEKPTVYLRLEFVGYAD